MLSNECLTWQLDWSDGRLRARMLRNWLTGHTFPLQDSTELALVLSAVPDRLQEPLTRVDDFAVRRVVGADAERATFELVSPSSGLEARLQYELDGPTRRKWAEVHNPTTKTRLLLDIELDGFSTDAPLSGGGQGQPVFLGDEVFAAVQYPSGENRVADSRVTLAHFPGCVLPPGGRLGSQTAIISVAEAGGALAHFTEYIQERCRRPKRVLSVYTPFGINNQWGPCPTLDDEETLHVLDRLAEWQRQGVQFDYFTLDTGWVDPSSDLTRFRPTCYPNGPQAVIERVKELGMQFGLWFATSWGAESCWDYPPAWAGQEGPAMGYLNGCPAKAHYPGSFCLACEPYADLLKNAVLHHIRENGVRFVKLDGGNYTCDDPAHDHLPGRYSTERMFGRLIDLADAARAEAPDVFVMWYWGLRSPFWALHGDSIFESGLHMEGSGTSAFPALHYRDSVTLAQDQNAQHARTVPPLVKDSLGVWLADTRWGNFMGKRRWREALVMDLGRGSLLFPNLWGDVYLLDKDDVRFLAWISSLARKHESLFLNRRTVLGDPWRNEVYGYAHCRGSRGFLFINNAHFASRRATFVLGESLGLKVKAGTPLRLTALFPERQQLLRDDGSPYCAGEAVDLCLRPFEVLMLEVKPARGRASSFPTRQLSHQEAADLGAQLLLRVTSPDPELGVEFVEAARFATQGFVEKAYGFKVRLPDLAGPQPILAVVVRLRRGDEEWRYSPAVAEIVQVRARIGDQNVQLVPMPDARQFGNTQKAGCSWVVYTLRLSREWSGRLVTLAVHAWLPAEVEAHTEAWVVKRWWREDARPIGDGYHADAPS